MRTSAATTASAWACTWGGGACWRGGRPAAGPALRQAWGGITGLLLNVSKQNTQSNDNNNNIFCLPSNEHIWVDTQMDKNKTRQKLSHKNPSIGSDKGTIEQKAD